MKVVAVEGVGVGAEDDPEAAAPRVVDRSKESADVLVAAAPAVLDRDPAAVGEEEGADVDRVGAAMLAEPGAGAIVDRPAAVGAEALHLRDPASEPGLRGRLQRLAGPAREAERQRAGHRSEIGHRRADVEELDGADGAAAVAEIAVGEGFEADSFAAEVGAALEDILRRRLAGLDGWSRLMTARRDAGREKQGQQEGPAHGGKVLRTRPGVNVGKICSFFVLVSQGFSC
jgi:hypothetical protein